MGSLTDTAETRWLAEALTKEHAFEQYVEVLYAQADRRPLLIILDDLQWADAASINLLFQAGVHRAWGVLHRLTGEYAQAETRLEMALEMFQDMDTRWEIGRTFSELAQLKLAQDNPDQAKQLYHQALDSFEQVGARPDASRIRQALASI
jgi:uncharacterized protein HemY